MRRTWTNKIENGILQSGPQKCVISNAFSFTPWQNQWHSVSFSAWAFCLPPLSISFFFLPLLSIGYKSGWRILELGIFWPPSVPPEIRASDRDRGHDKYRFLPSFGSDKIEVVTRGERNDARTNGQTNEWWRTAAKRLWRFVTGVKAAARDLGPFTQPSVICTSMKYWQGTQLPNLIIGNKTKHI